MAPKWCCGSSSPADPEIGVSAPGGGGVGAPATSQAPKSGRVKRMVRLAAELLLLLGLLLLTLHITVLRSSPLPQGNGTVSVDQDTALTEVSPFVWFLFRLWYLLIKKTQIKCSYDARVTLNPENRVILWGVLTHTGCGLPLAGCPRGLSVSQQRGGRWRQGQRSVPWQRHTSPWLGVNC